MYKKADDRDKLCNNRTLGIDLRSLAAASQLIEDDTEDPEERARRIAAEQEAKNIGAVLGLTIGIVSAIADRESEEHEIELQEEYNEYQAQEDLWEQTM